MLYDHSHDRNSGRRLSFQIRKPLCFTG